MKPGDPVFVNSLLTNPGGLRLRVIHETVQFPRDKIVFTLARLGVAAELAEATMIVDLRDKAGVKVKDKQAAQSVDVTITAKKSLPDGPVLELQFRLADSKEQTIKLTHAAEALDEEGKKVAGLQVTTAPELVVSSGLAPPPAAVLGCFFFTH